MATHVMGTWEQLASNPGPLSHAHTKTEENGKKRTWLQAREQSDSSQKPQDSISGEACISLTTLYMAVCLASFLSKIYSLINPYMYMCMCTHVFNYVRVKILNGKCITHRQTYKRGCYNRRKESL